MVDVPIRVVIVTMDSHLSLAASRAAEAMRRDVPGLVLAVHGADAWGDDADALARAHADIACGDIVIATMLFLDDHIRAMQPALAARRAHCDAMVCAMSAGEIVKLTRVGKFDMAAEPTGAMALLKKLRGSRKQNKSSGAGQMRMLRNLPKVMKLIPGTAQDVRAYFLSLQCWLSGSEENLESLMRLLIGRYAAGPRAVLRGIATQAPVEYPDVGLYHPDAAGRILTRAADLPRRGPVRGTVGVLLLRSYVLAGNAGHYDGVIAALEAAHLRVVPAFASGLDQRPAIEKYFMADGRATVDAVISLTGFSLVGGPAYNDAHAAETILAALDVPYITAHPVEFQTLAQWERDPRGLTPVEATMMVALPELDGGMWPMTFGGRADTDTEAAGRTMVAHPERAATLAGRVAKLIALRRTRRADRRVGIVLFNFPPNGGAVGTAAYLSVFESLHHTLCAMRDAGYDVEPPADADALRAALLDGNAQRHGTVANVAALISADDIVRREPHLAEIEAVWGAAPGRQLSDGASVFVLGRRFGNVFVGLQPAFGIEGDPMRLMFEGGFAPTHAFSAFYRWLAEDFSAHAVLHFGTHGALEFMPGKHTGLSDKCWPDRLIGSLPNFNIYAANNPSEGMLAKRRAGATLISHMTPPVVQAGLYRGLADVKASIARWRSMDPASEGGQMASLARLIQAEAAAVDLAEAEPAWDDADRRIAALGGALLELEYSLIPHGLHVIGRPLDPAQRAQMLDAADVTDPVRRAVLDTALATDTETPAILHALDGGYLRPAPGGDFLRNPDIAPTGRNLHGFDPFRIPSAFALADGARQADRLLARHAQDFAALPETVAIVLWGTDNLKTEGGPIAQALALMGAAPRLDAYGRVCGAALRPLAELGRPRIDVVMTLSGIFRDLLPLQTKLLAEAALMAAEADEPVAQNFVRRHALDYIALHGGDMQTAALRVFGNADSAYGANVNQLVESGAWSDEDELADAYVRRKGFAYGVDGRPERHETVHAHALKTVDVTYQNLDSVELGITAVDNYFDTLGGITRAVRRARGGTPAAVYIGDQTRGDGMVRTLGEQVSLETRTRALNPKYYEALLSHGYEGVRQIEAQITNTFGWSATTGEVQPWVYQQITETYVLDADMRERLAALNPAASAKIANRMLEAYDRKYWSPDDDTLAALRSAADDLEDRLEGVGPGPAMELAA